MPHIRRPFSSRHYPCHVTLRAKRGVLPLRSRRLLRELQRSFARACEREDFRVVHYSVQTHQAHLIVEADSARALGRGMNSIAARFARAVNRVFGRRGAVLADHYHMRPLHTPREVRNAISYVLLNVRKHRPEGARVGGEVVDPASSGPWFPGWTVALPRPPDPPPVAAARTWLLSCGWLRHGRIDPREIPGRQGHGR